MSERFEDLKRLSEMLERGEITQGEYETVKAELMAEMGAPEATPTESPAPESESDSTPASREGDVSDVQPDQSTPLFRKRSFWLVAAIVVAWVLYVSTVSGGGGGSSAEHEAVEAYVVCQDFVEDRLVSPSTAEFGGPYSRVTTHNGEGEYTVETYVDSENRFGAMVRTEFTCTVQHTEGASYRLESLDLNG